MKIAKAYAIKDAKISFVSLVDKAANKMPFLIAKAEKGTAEFSTFSPILKADSATHYVTGVVYAPMTEDTDGNYMTAEEIQKAAYNFAKDGNKVDLQHCFKTLDGASVVESYVTKSDCTIGGTSIKEGTWILTAEITNDDVWGKIEKGELTGFSMGGVGTYDDTDVALDTVEKAEKKGILAKLSKMLGLDAVEKGLVKDHFDNRNRRESVWAANDALSSVLWSYDENGEYVQKTEEELKEALSEFSEIVLSIFQCGKIEKSSKNTPIIKVGKSISAKNKATLKGVYDSIGILLNAVEDDETKEETEQMEKAEIQKMIGETIAPITAALDEIKKSMMPAAPAPTPTPTPAVPKADEVVTKADIAGVVKKALEEALNEDSEAPEDNGEDEAPVTKSDVQKIVSSELSKIVEPLKKARGLSAQIAGVQKAEEPEHYLKGIL